MSLRSVIGTVLLAVLLAALASVPAVAGNGDDGDDDDGEGLRFVTLTAALEGANEIPGPGDPDGFGVAEVNISKRGVVCFGIAVEAITLPATAAHIHEGVATVAGDIVVTLEPPEPFGSAPTGVSTGCVTNVKRSLVRDIIRNPDEYYVNVHTTDFPAGAVRGQLSAAA
jgi:hypothetical protein